MIILRRMAGETILWSVLKSPIYMTRLTINIRMRPAQWERSGTVIIEHIQPASRLVTGCAVRAKLSLMIVLRGMTGIAVLRRILEVPILMTRQTISGCVCTFQGEFGLAMIERYIRPPARCVTQGAVRAELAFMVILRRMTGITILRRILIHSINVTTCTFDIGMQTS